MGMSTLNKQAKTKYRPVLTPDEVSYLHRILKKAYVDNLTQDSAKGFSTVEEDYCLSLMNKFSALDAKIRNNVASPAYTSKEHSPQEEVLLDLGGTPPVPAYSTGTYANPGERRLSAYKKYCKWPEMCNSSELADAMEHRFNNDLMSIEEATAYEARMWERL
jgi:hypothetical protein